MHFTTKILQTLEMTKQIANSKKSADKKEESSMETLKLKHWKTLASLQITQQNDHALRQKYVQKYP